MALPALPIAAGIAGLALVGLRARAVLKQKKLATIASLQNANTDKVNAANAALAAQGIIAAGAGPRKVEASNLMQGPDGITFSLTSPAAFLTSLDTKSADDEAFENSQWQPGDILTVDAQRAGLTSSQVPSGNILVRVTGAPDMAAKLIPAQIIDPRLPSVAVQVPFKSWTDGIGAKGDFAHHIVGMGQ